MLAVPNTPGPSFHSSAYAVPANEKPFFSCMAGKLLCKTHLPWQTFPDSALSFSPLSCSCPGPHRSDWSPSTLCCHIPLYPVFYQNEGATERNFRLGMDHRCYLNLEGRQTTLGGKLNLFSCFRVLVYFISSPKYYAFYVWPLKLFSGCFFLLLPGSHSQQAGQSGGR